MQRHHRAEATTGELSSAICPPNLVGMQLYTAGMFGWVSRTAHDSTGHFLLHRTVFLSLLRNFSWFKVTYKHHFNPAKWCSPCPDSKVPVVVRNINNVLTSIYNIFLLFAWGLAWIWQHAPAPALGKHNLYKSNSNRRQAAGGTGTTFLPWRAHGMHLQRRCRVMGQKHAPFSLIMHKTEAIKYWTGQKCSQDKDLSKTKYWKIFGNSLGSEHWGKANTHIHTPRTFLF